MLTCPKSVHPGVKSLWEFHQAGDPARVATMHDGCGTAIRVAMVGMLFTSDALDALVNGAREASISPHAGSLAIAAAAANAAAVSAAIDEASSPQVLSLAEWAATASESRWPVTLVRLRSDSRFHDDQPLPTVYHASDVAARWFPDPPITDRAACSRACNDDELSGRGDSARRQRCWR